MNSIQKLELETTELFKQKEYSKVVYEITSQTKEEQRSTLLCNLLGLSRIINKKRNKDALTLAIKDFKLGYLKEKNTTHAIDCLANFITTNRNKKVGQRPTIKKRQLYLHFCIRFRQIMQAF